MEEEIIRFGEDATLVGILSKPRASSPAHRIACLFPNVGLAHRIGPHRLNVRLARGLSEIGIASFRFDLSGVGDSSTLHSRDSYLEQATRDMRAAMDCLQSGYGIDRYLVFGICSGAANGYRLALEDPRVVGVLMLDGFSYPSKWNRVADMARRIWLLSLRQAPSFFVERLQNVKRKLQLGPITGLDASIEVISPPKEEFIREINALIHRGASVYFVFSGSVQATSGDWDQFSGLGVAPFLGNVRCEYWGDVDHTATSLHSQKRLLESLRDWALDVSASPINAE